MIRNLTCLLAVLTLPVAAQLPADKSLSTQELAKLVKPSIVVVTFSGRTGEREGYGTGFVVGDGLIATNHHVIGEARPIKVTFSDGSETPVVEVHASDRRLDLAVLKVDEKELPALPLGDSDALADGAEIVVIGNPQGLDHSVVDGVLSGRRQIDGQRLLQLAIPIEPGNSGGPVLDRFGRVHGIVNIKSAITANLGFAVEINDLKKLLERPNPIPMNRWLTIGALSDADWTMVFGGDWRQRAGRLLVHNRGKSFGGRTLCLTNRSVPKRPFDLEVSVKLDDESGAAGLVFHSDGKDRHYGFYPSNGRIRLTRFDGPSVFTWTILAEIDTPHYRRGEWNTLRVRVKEDGITGFVNGHQILDSADTGLTKGRVGLAKFRHTAAEFRRFRIGSELPMSMISDEQVMDILAAASAEGEDINLLGKDSDATATVLGREVRRLEQEAARLRRTISRVHAQAVVDKMRRECDKENDKIDLAYAALLLASLDNRELDVETYVENLKRMTEEIQEGLSADSDDAERLDKLDAYLFKENGFHGSRTDYYNRSNSYMNEVLDDREGLPITLSVLYITLARRIGLNVVGVALPGHFVAGYQPEKGDIQLLDIFDGGKRMSREEASVLVFSMTGQPLIDSDMEPAKPHDIIVRMVRNLMNLAERDGDAEALLQYTDVILAVNPDSDRDRWFRAALLTRLGRKDEARKDLDHLIDKGSEDFDVHRLLELRRLLTEE
jgi:regulator of sirC expression with transglutaminase-like and TPR domain